MTEPAAVLGRLDPPMRTAAWYGDRVLDLALPARWEVTVHWPRTPEPLTEDEIRAQLRSGSGQAALATLAAGRRRVAIVVDDLTRPTPVDRILPPVVEELGEAGIGDDAICVIVATGTHGPSRAGVERKVGAEMARRLRTEVHDDLHGCVRVGITSFGSPVFANARVVAADLVIGIGGIYPQHTVGFGGGSKIVLGILGRRSIERLHYRHPSIEGRHDVVSTFRQDVDEMARMIGLGASVSAMVDAQRRLVWLRSGDPAAYFDAACAETVGMFGAPPPGDADVVISNAYPMDLSATFVRSKGVIPLLRARPGASRVLIGAASEGVGHHGLFPLEPGRLGAVRGMLRTARNAPRGELPRLVRNRLAGVARLVRRPPAKPASASREVLLHPTAPDVNLPRELAGMRSEPSWQRILETIAAEQGRDRDLRVVIYPCSPLQVLEVA